MIAAVLIIASGVSMFAVVMILLAPADPDVPDKIEPRGGTEKQRTANVLPPVRRDIQRDRRQQRAQRLDEIRRMR